MSKTGRKSFAKKSSRKTRGGRKTRNVRRNRMRGGNNHYYCDDEKDGMRDCTGRAVIQPNFDAGAGLFELYKKSLTEPITAEEYTTLYDNGLIRK